MCLLSVHVCLLCVEGLVVNTVQCSPPHHVCIFTFISSCVFQVAAMIKKKKMPSEFYIDR